MSNLYLDGPPARPATAEPAAPPTVKDEEVFDPSSFPFEPRTYRIHFKNGCSGEYEGAALAIQFPFDPREVKDVSPA